MPSDCSLGVSHCHLNVTYGRAAVRPEPGERVAHQQKRRRVRAIGEAEKDGVGRAGQRRARERLAVVIDQLEASAEIGGRRLRVG